LQEIRPEDLARSEEEVGSLRFVLVDGVCSVLYASLYILPGFFLHNQLEQVAAFFQRLGVSAFLLLLILAGGYLSYRLLKRRQPRVTNSIHNLDPAKATHRVQPTANTPNSADGVCGRME
jgi:hypothetical protein